MNLGVRLLSTIDDKWYSSQGDKMTVLKGDPGTTIKKPLPEVIGSSNSISVGFATDASSPK